MDTTLWAKTHGAATHFPLALVFASGAFDTASVLLVGRPAENGLRSAGYWTLLIAALGTFPAVASGLLMTKGSLLGHDALRMHHLFVWPAFALVIGLTTWRVSIGQRSTHGQFSVYLTGVAIANVLMLAAGYWGGEMMIAR